MHLSSTCQMQIARDVLRPAVYKETQLHDGKTRSFSTVDRQDIELRGHQAVPASKRNRDETSITRGTEHWKCRIQRTRIACTYSLGSRGLEKAQSSCSLVKSFICQTTLATVDEKDSAAERAKVSVRSMSTRSGSGVVSIETGVLQSPCLSVPMERTPDQSWLATSMPTARLPRCQASFS